MLLSLQTDKELLETKKECEKALKEVKKEIQKRKLEKFTKNEIAILKNCEPKYKYIARDEDGILNLFISKPHKFGVMWENVDNTIYHFKKFESLFYQVSWEDEEPFVIRTILKEEVVE